MIGNISVNNACLLLSGGFQLKLSCMSGCLDIRVGSIGEGGSGREGGFHFNVTGSVSCCRGSDGGGGNSGGWGGGLEGPGETGWECGYRSTVQM